jgi:hypothetical protein
MGVTSMWIYRCPATNQFVEASIKTTEDKLRRLGSLQLPLWCPLCHGAHSVHAREVLIGEETQHPRGGGDRVALRKVFEEIAECHPVASDAGSGPKGVTERSARTHAWYRNPDR